MIDNRKIKYFQKQLLEWYENNGRFFMWRKKGLSNYDYIIAEILLQRTKAESVAKFYPLFIKRFPNWTSLVNAEEAEISNYLKPLGLYTQRSGRLKKLAIEMVTRYGRLPRKREELEAIPYMGQYIANAVELLIFNKPSPLIDVNMSRVLERFFGPRKMADIRYDPYLQDLSYQVVKHGSSKEINWAILDFSALICRPKPLCSTCMLKMKCEAYKKIYSKID